MPDVQLNAQALVTTSASSTPGSGASQSWTVTALPAGFPALRGTQTFALIDATPGASAAQQAEVVRVTACTGAGATTITVTRGADGTTPVAHSTPATFNVVLVQSYLNREAAGQPDYAPEILSSQYNGLRGIYNYMSANTRKLDQGIGDSAANGVSRHVIIGDSVSAGITSAIGTNTADRLRAWPLAMRDTLALFGVPANGTGFVRINDNGLADARWTQVPPTATISNQTSWTFVQSTGSLTFVADRAGSVVEVEYLDTNSVTFQVSVDGATTGGGFTTVNTAASGSTWKRVRLFTLSQPVRVGSRITIFVTVVGSGLGLAGISVFSPNSGLIIDNLSQSGSTAGGTGAGAWGDAAAGPYVPMAASSGRARTVTDAVTTAGQITFNSATANFTALDVGEPIDQFPDTSGALFPPNTWITGVTGATQALTSNAALISATGKTLRISRDPACVHIALGGNDMIQRVGSVGVTTALADIRTAVLALRANYPNSDCILHLQNEPSTTLVTPANELLFQQAMYRLADEMNVPLYDWRDRAGSYSTAFANGMMQDYQAHMTPGTYESLGGSLAMIIGGAGGRPQAWNDPVADGDLVNKRDVDGKRRSTQVNANATALSSAGSVFYLTPSRQNLANTLIPGDEFKWTAVVTNTATIQTATIRLHAGAVGGSTDTVIQSLALPAGTAAAGTAHIEITATVRTVGAAGTAVLIVELRALNNRNSVGFMSEAVYATTNIVTTVFDTTVTQYLGISVSSTVANIVTAQKTTLEIVRKG